MNPGTGTHPPKHIESRRTVLITGASAGIGEAFAEKYAAERFDLVITARREDRLRKLAERLAREHGVRVRVIVQDLAHPDAPSRLCEQISAESLTIDVLVNNAGYGIPGSYLTSPWEHHAAQMQVMITATAELTHRLLPAMVARGYGRIINVASLAALVPAPAGHTLYAACKASSSSSPSRWPTKWASSASTSRRSVPASR